MDSQLIQIDPAIRNLVYAIVQLPSIHGRGSFTLDVYELIVAWDKSRTEQLTIYQNTIIDLINQGTTSIRIAGGVASEGKGE